MTAKLVIIFFLLAIAYTLGSSFWFLIRDRGAGTRTARRLAWRAGLSLILFLIIMLAIYTGWLKPGSQGPIRYTPAAESTGKNG